MTLTETSSELQAKGGGDRAGRGRLSETRRETQEEQGGGLRARGAGGGLRRSGSAPPRSHGGRPNATGPGGRGGEGEEGTYASPVMFGF